MIYQVTCKDRTAPHITKVLSNVEKTHSILGNTKKSLEYYEEVTQLGREIYRVTSHPDMAKPLNTMGLVYYRIGNVEKAIQSLRRSTHTTLPKGNGDIRSEIFQNLGKTYQTVAANTNIREQKIAYASKVILTFNLAVSSPQCMLFLLYAKHYQQAYNYFRYSSTISNSKLVYNFLERNLIVASLLTKHIIQSMLVNIRAIVHAYYVITLLLQNI